MNKTVLLVFLLWIAPFVFVAFWPFTPVNAQNTLVCTLPRPRFERIYSERTEGVVDKMTVYHDKETGNEIICAYMYGGDAASTSCFQTGRNWK